MRVPEADEQLAGPGGPLALPLGSDGTIQFPDPVVYPPPGFLPAGGFDYGNGDVTGYYWPIGGEAGPPVWCETAHDEWSLQPVAVSLSDFLAEQLTDEDAPFREEAEWVEGQLAAPHPRRAPLASAKGLLERGRVAMGEDRLADAEADLRAAIGLLPEYGQAHIALASVLRRQRNTTDALRHELIAAGCPSCFTADRGSAIRRVVASGDDALPEGASDPFFRRRKELTFQTGVKYNDDFLLYEDIIAELHHAAEHVRAIRMRVLVGELMQSETTAFWERYGWSPAHQAERLRAEIEAHLPARRPVVVETSGPW